MPRRKPRLAPDIDIVSWLLSLPADLRRAAIRRLGADLATGLDRDWPSWAHDGQLAPPGPWRTWVIMAGRGFGKTRAGAEWIAGHAADASARIALVGATIEDARKVMVEGVSGLIAVAGDRIAEWRPSIGRLRFASGAEAALYSGACPAKLRGPEHSHAWCDELAKWAKPEEAWDMLQLGLRLGDDPRALVTTTPRLCDALEAILADPATAVTHGPTQANPHLPGAFVAAVERQYGGTRMGEAELEGKMPRGRVGALWSREMIERARLHSTSVGVERSRDTPVLSLVEGSLDFARDEREGGGPIDVRTIPNALSWSPPPPPAPIPRLYYRLAIGLDPPAAGGTCGIVVCAVDREGIGHVLEDASVSGASPEGWAAAVARAWARWRGQADSALIVAEVNQGGDMVRSVLRNADEALARAVKDVRAHHGKAVRAEPVAMLFEQRRVRLHGRFELLEKELLRMVAAERCVPSPDRADAMVWSLTELIVRPKSEPRIMQL